MTGPVSRRGMIAGLVGAAAIGAAGAAGALLRRDDTQGSVRSTTTSTAPPATTGDAPAATSSTAPPETSPPETEPPPAPEVLEILCRSAWGAAPAGTGRPHTIRQITVHHSATRLERNAEVVGNIRRYQQDHQARGWADLAYHYVIDAEGNVFEARSTSIAGDTATSYDPSGHFLAMCDGNFEEQPLPEAQFEGLARLLAWAVVQHGLSVDAISTHRDHAATACPGQALAARVDGGELARRVEALLASGVEVTVLCGPEGEGRVAEIAAA